MFPDIDQDWNSKIPLQSFFIVFVDRQAMVMGVKMIEQNKHVRHVIYTLWSGKTQLPRPLPSIILALEQLTPCGDQMTPPICGLDNARQSRCGVSLMQPSHMYI